MDSYRVVELVDPREPDLPRAVFACPCHYSPWRGVWQRRNKLNNRLSEWFRRLSEAKTEPLERVFLGRAGLSERCARAVCKYRIEQVARMAGTWPEYPDFFAMDQPENVGGRGRPCAVLAGERVQAFPSVAEAARCLGVARETVSRAVREGRQCGGGRVV